MTLRFQLLPCAVEIAAEDETLARTLRYVVNTAEQPVRPLQAFHYRILGRGPYDILEDGDLLERAPGPDAVLSAVYRRCHQRAFHLLALGGWSFLHCALVRVGGRRLLVGGSKRAGKTTLMLRLLYDGFAVEGDELAVIRNGEVVAFPRRFHLKPGVEAIVPEVARVRHALPTTPGWEGDIAAFDPREAGFPWRLDIGPVDAVVVAEPNHGGRSTLTETAPGEMVRRLLPQARRTDDSAESRARLVAACAGLVAQGGYTLELGDLREACDALASIPARPLRRRPDVALH